MKSPVLIKDDLKMDVSSRRGWVVNTLKELTNVEAGLAFPPTGSSPDNFPGRPMNMIGVFWLRNVSATLRKEACVLFNRRLSPAA